MNTDDSANTAPQLSAIELRVIGVLMEKQLTTPDAYPLTLNSIVTACNQKSSREPISNYTQGEVDRTLLVLCDRKLVRLERGSRANKYEQLFMQQLELGKQHQAVLCVMMLRGPQSFSELQTRTQRMFDFSDKAVLAHCIDRLCNRDIPFATRLAQQAGQRGERVTHLFSGTPENVSSSKESIYDETETHGVATNTSLSQTSPLAHPDREALTALKQQLAQTQDLLETLQLEMMEQKSQLENLYRLTNNSQD